MFVTFCPESRLHVSASSLNALLNLFSSCSVSAPLLDLEVACSSTSHLSRCINASGPLMAFSVLPKLGFGEPKLSYHGMGTRVYSTVEPRYHVQARCGRVSFSCPFWAWWCKVLTVKCLCPRAIHSLSSYGHKCTVDRHGQDTMRTESQPLLCCWRYCCGVVALS